MKTLNDDKHQWALQGESLHLEVQNDTEVLTQGMDEVMDDMRHLINECHEIEVQVDAMCKGIGTSFWPILQVHIEKYFMDVERNIVVIKPRGYNL